MSTDARNELSGLVTELRAVEKKIRELIREANNLKPSPEPWAALHSIHRAVSDAIERGVIVPGGLADADLLNWIKNRVEMAGGECAPTPRKGEEGR